MLSRAQNETGSPQDATDILKVNIKDFDGPIYESIKVAPFIEAAPIPYVYDLSL